MEKTIKGPLDWHGKEEGEYRVGKYSVNNEVLAEFEGQQVELTIRTPEGGDDGRD